MSRHVGDSHVLPDQQHRHISRAGQLGEHLRMARSHVTGEAHRLFVDRRGDDRVHITRHGHARGAIDCFPRRPPGGSTGFPLAQVNAAGGSEVEHGDGIHFAGHVARCGDRADFGRARYNLPGCPQDLCITYHQRQARAANSLVPQRLEDDLRPDT
jgi:hypothetical protein